MVVVTSNVLWESLQLLYCSHITWPKFTKRAHKNTREPFLLAPPLKCPSIQTSWVLKNFRDEIKINLEGSWFGKITG